MDRCQECGYDYEKIRRGELAAVVGELASPYRARLEEDPVRLRTRRTVEWIARHTIHEGRHHLLDIESGMSRRE